MLCSVKTKRGLTRVQLILDATTVLATDKLWLCNRKLFNKGLHFESCITTPDVIWFIPVHTDTLLLLCCATVFINRLNTFSESIAQFLKVLNTNLKPELTILSKRHKFFSKLNETILLLIDPDLTRGAQIRTGEQ